MKQRPPTPVLLEHSEQAFLLMSPNRHIHPMVQASTSSLSLSILPRCFDSLRIGRRRGLNYVTNFGSFIVEVVVKCSRNNTRFDKVARGAIHKSFAVERLLLSKSASWRQTYTQKFR